MQLQRHGNTRDDKLRFQINDELISLIPSIREVFVSHEPGTKCSRPGRLTADSYFCTWHGNNGENKLHFMCENPRLEDNYLKERFAKIIIQNFEVREMDGMLCVEIIKLDRELVGLISSI